MENTFRSKIDTWILVLLIAALAGQAYVVFDVVTERVEAPQSYWLVAMTVAVSLLILSILMRTRYIVDAEKLTIYCGPFRWTVPLADIKSVAETRNPLSSPALSLDRIRIDYGSKRWVMVSPADKQGFYSAIGHSPDAGPNA